MDRTCGGCTACCTVEGVAYFNKPAYCACKHVTDKGCSIYEQRPDECRNYNCQWLWGNVPGEERRPDKFGVMFSWGPILYGKYAVIAFEVWPGAFEQLGWDKLTYLVSKFPQPMCDAPVVSMVYGCQLPPNPEFVGDGKYFHPKEANYNDPRISLTVVN